ncbi:glutamate-5-semialdehyde dehydrogenase [Mucilaginibacter sp. dw_454]|uniref:glutamate-5-semialdehyde dehydrogenase n=1 Tax=Mucilaginibacter sp. dw_454 TaxID=2720079 RepID=UPI001BD4A605|nr:glutamate-5-semialdehyde dehydrogenase [Mucilaginibacter sp. dw_454]
MSYTTYFENAQLASRNFNLSEDAINLLLTDLAAETLSQTHYLLRENQKDLDNMDPANPNYDRLQLTVSRIRDIVNHIIDVSRLENPLGHILSEKTMPNGLHISKVSVPLGVVGVIYEARPNVTFDVFVLCFKTGNVCVLKGGSDAAYSNQAIIGIIHKVLSRHNVNVNVATLLPKERDAAEALMQAVGYVDVIIPRGSQGLINSVRKNSKVPVIETGAGIVHVYFDQSGDLQMATNIVFNSKTRRVSVCNALDCLIIHAARLKDLPELTVPLAKAGVEIFADEQSYDQLQVHYPSNLLHKAGPEHFGIEFLSMKMAIKTIDSFEDALEHIASHSSKHSEAIIAEDAAVTEEFLNRVDAAAVYVNAATSFTDGAQFGLGAEIGISTQKLHARGPMGLQELTSYKWLIKGNGQTRS